ncbi:TauD/TfdA family dioxygenase [Rhodobacteraceae bacterium NNCM2]|nr:TauD/TfdA family dioxygenase [Coraliihabitans acroporae]
MTATPRLDFASFTLSPLTLHIGAEVDGIDLTAPMSAEVAAELTEALAAWKVLFFREQPLDHAQHVAFARQLGEPTIGHAVFGHDGDHPEIYSVGKHRTANSIRHDKTLRSWTDWHADVTAAVNPPSISILRGVDIPPYGGDTFWTNLAAAYDGLSEPLRAFLETLDAAHRFEMPTPERLSEAYLKEVRERQMESIHPLVTVHPVSGEKVLFVSPDFIYRIEGLAPRESQALLEFLWEHAVRPEYSVRYKWRPGDVAMWDNRSTAHLAPSDIFDTEFDRQLYRVTLVGEKPVGVDGRISRAVSGAPILSLEEELKLRAS